MNKKQDKCKAKANELFKSCTLFTMKGLIQKYLFYPMLSYKHALQMNVIRKKYTLNIRSSSNGMSNMETEGGRIEVRVEFGRISRAK